MINYIDLTKENDTELTELLVNIDSLKMVIDVSRTEEGNSKVYISPGGDSLMVYNVKESYEEIRKMIADSQLLKIKYKI